MKYQEPQLIEIQEQEKESLKLSKRSFLTAIIVIAVLMLASFALTIILPQCSIPVWKFLLSPVLVLTVDGSATIIAVLIFLLVIGGIFNALGECGLMKYMLGKIAYKFGAKKYKLMAIVMLFFMAMGALIGSFEECVPLVPIVVGLAIRLGWDQKVGLAMSMLSVGCGFASGVFNPFTVGVAQELAGLRMFSGAWLRILGFVLIYALLLFFVMSYAKKHDAGYHEMAEFQSDLSLDLGFKLFAGIMIAGIILVFCSAFIKVLQDYTLIIVAIMFLVAGIAASMACKLRGKAFFKSFGSGVVNMLPALLMILMASSIKYTLETAGALEVMLNGAIKLASTMPKWEVILFIYLIVLVMNFFIASGSAKAFMLIPLIVPLAEVFGISAQLCIVAFAFGDGFSNVFYPTNPALLISLGLADVSYTDWAKWSGKFQLANILLTSAILLFGLAIGY